MKKTAIIFVIGLAAGCGRPVPPPSNVSAAPVEAMLTAELPQIPERAACPEPPYQSSHQEARDWASDRIWQAAQAEYLVHFAVGRAYSGEDLVRLNCLVMKRQAIKRLRQDMLYQVERAPAAELGRQVKMLCDRVVRFQQEARQCFQAEDRTQS